MVYANVGVSGSQKDDNFQVMDCAFFSPFDITTVGQYLWVRWVEEPEQWTGYPLSPVTSHFTLVLLFAQNATLASLGY